MQWVLFDVGTELYYLVQFKTSQRVDEGAIVLWIQVKISYINMDFKSVFFLFRGEYKFVLYHGKQAKSTNSRDLCENVRKEKDATLFS